MTPAELRAKTAELYERRGDYCPDCAMALAEWFDVRGSAPRPELCERCQARQYASPHPPGKLHDNIGMANGQRVYKSLGR